MPTAPFPVPLLPKNLGLSDLLPGRRSISAVDIREIAAAATTYGIAVYLFFEEQLARSTALELVIHKFRDVPEFERPYVRIGDFLRFVQENDPSFEQVMQAHPIMIEIITVAEIAANPNVPALVYITGVMPYSDELQF